MCKPCPTGKTSKWGSVSLQECVQICGPGTYTDNGTCKPCPSGTIQPVGQTDAYSTPFTSCTTCPSGKVPNDAKTQCIPIASPSGPTGPTGPTGARISPSGPTGARISPSGPSGPTGATGRPVSAGGGGEPPAKPEEGLDTLEIVAIVVGALILLILIIVAIYFATQKNNPNYSLQNYYNNFYRPR